jgi:hypothetical protein
MNTYELIARGQTSGWNPAANSINAENVFGMRPVAVQTARDVRLSGSASGLAMCLPSRAAQRCTSCAGMVLVLIHLRSYNAKSRRRRWRPWRKANQALMRALFAQLALWRVDTMKSLSSS